MASGQADKSKKAASPASSAAAGPQKAPSGKPLDQTKSGTKNANEASKNPSAKSVTAKSLGDDKKSGMKGANDAGVSAVSKKSPAPAAGATMPPPKASNAAKAPVPQKKTPADTTTKKPANPSPSKVSPQGKNMGAKKPDSVKAAGDKGLKVTEVPAKDQGEKASATNPNPSKQTAISHGKPLSTAPVKPSPAAAVLSGKNAAASGGGSGNLAKEKDSSIKPVAAAKMGQNTSNTNPGLAGASKPVQNTASAAQGQPKSSNMPSANGASRPASSGTVPAGKQAVQALTTINKPLAGTVAKEKVQEKEKVASGVKTQTKTQVGTVQGKTTGQPLTKAANASTKSNGTGPEGAKKPSVGSSPPPSALNPAPGAKNTQGTKQADSKTKQVPNSQTPAASKQKVEGAKSTTQGTEKKLATGINAGKVVASERQSEPTTGVAKIQNANGKPEAGKPASQEKKAPEQKLGGKSVGGVKGADVAATKVGAQLPSDGTRPTAKELEGNKQKSTISQSVPNSEKKPLPDQTGDKAKASAAVEGTSAGGTKSEKPKPSATDSKDPKPATTSSTTSQQGQPPQSKPTTTTGASQVASSPSPKPAPTSNKVPQPAVPPAAAKSSISDKPASATAVPPAKPTDNSQRSTTDARWMRMYQRLKSYQEKNGTTEVPENDEVKTNQALRRWVALQRKQYQGIEIPADRKKLLEDLGFQWTAPRPAGGKKAGKGTKPATIVKSTFMGICVSVDGNEKVWFNLLPNTSMSKVIENIPFSKYGILREDAKFFVAGRRRKNPIQPTDTPASLGLSDGDQIDLVVTSSKSIYNKQVARQRQDSSSGGKKADSKGKSPTLSISVCKKGKEDTRTIFKVNPSTRMGAIFDNLPYSKYGVASKHDVQFYVSGGPGPLLASQSVESLGLQHGDQIDLVVTNQSGTGKPTASGTSKSSTAQKKRPSNAASGQANAARNVRPRKEGTEADLKNDNQESATKKDTQLGTNGDQHLNKDQIRWMKMYDQLKQNGSEEVLESDNRRLYQFVLNQRRKLHSGELQKDRRDLLDGLSFSWQTRPTLVGKNSIDEQEDSQGESTSVARINNAVDSLISSKKVAPRHQKMWLQKYEELKVYKEKFGTTMVSRKEEHSSLQQWSSRQRRLRWEGTLSEDRIELLDQISFIWDTMPPAPAPGGALEPGKPKRADDDYGFEQKDYESEESDSYVSSGEQMEPEGDTQQKSSGNNQPKSLAPIYQQMWKKKFQELKNYKKKFGTATIPNGHREYKNLYRWCWRQRGFYHQKTMLPDRQKLLEDLGFEWDIKDEDDKKKKSKKELEEVVESDAEEVSEVPAPAPAPSRDDEQQPQQQQLPIIAYAAEYQRRWMHHYNSLKAFQRKHGHQNVGSRHNKALYFWMVRQRQALKANKMSGDRKEFLDDIGFDWEFKYEKKGEANEEEVPTQEEEAVEEEEEEEEEEEKEEEESASSDSEDSQGSAPTGGVTKERRKGYDDKWMKQFKELKAYKRKNGTVEVRYSDFANRGLYYWVWRHRKLYRLGELPKPRVKLLNSINFEWNKGGGDDTKSKDTVEDTEGGDGDGDGEAADGDDEGGEEVDSDISSSDDEEDSSQGSSGTGGQVAAAKVFQDQWMSNYDKLCSFKKKYGTTEVGYSKEAYRSLYYWVWRQKKYNREKSLQDDRKQLLKKIGFDFGGRGGDNKGKKGDDTSEDDDDSESETVPSHSQHTSTKKASSTAKKHKRKGSEVEKPSKGPSKKKRKAENDGKKRSNRTEELLEDDDESFDEASIPLEVGKVEDMENYLDSVELQIQEKEDELRTLRATQARLQFMVKRARPHLPRNKSNGVSVAAAAKREQDLRPPAKRRRRLTD